MFSISPAMSGSSSIKSIQRGEILAASAPAIVVVNEVDVDNSVLLLHATNNRSPWGRFVNSTTLEMSANDGATVYWQLVEFVSGPAAFVPPAGPGQQVDVLPAMGENVAFISSGETGAIDYDGDDYAEDSWQSAQVWGGNGANSVGYGSEQVFVGGDAGLTPQPVRYAGGNSIKIVLREQDGQRGGRWRNELRSPPGRNLNYGDTYYQRMSVFFPDTQDMRNAIALLTYNQNFCQWHFDGGACSMHTRDNKFFFGATFLAPAAEREFGAVTLGVWHDFVFQIKCHMNDGIFGVWHREQGGNYVKELDYTGRLAMKVNDYMNPKIGIYRADGAFGSQVNVSEVVQIYDHLLISKPNLGTFAEFA